MNRTGLRRTILVFLFSAARMFGAVPTLDHLYPDGFQLGTTGQVQLIGKFDPWPPRLWVDDAAIRFVASTNKGEGSLEVSSNAAVGAHLIRVFNDEGSSRPRVLVIDDQPQIREQEPNDDRAAAQSITRLPAVINGRLEKSGDVDSFSVGLTVGQTLIAFVDAYVLESPVDAVLRILDSRGVPQTWNHDGRTLDPFLTFSAPAAGTYVVQVMGFPYPATSEIRFHGNEKCVYRLHLHGGPFLSHTVPLGVRRSGHTKLGLFGWNFAADTPRELDWTEQKNLTETTGGSGALRLCAPKLENALKIPCGDGIEGVEVEPNDTVSQAQPLEVPGAVTGCIQTAGDEDRYLISVKKRDRFRMNVQSASLGFPVDAWLKIERTNSTQVERNDDRGGPDPDLEWEAGSDGTFVVAVGNLLHRGGSNYLYRLSVTRAQPDYRATMTEHSFVVRAGATNEVKIAVSRVNGYTNAISVHLAGLPEGVSAEAVDAPEKKADVTLKMIAATNAPPFSGPIRVMVGSKEAERAAQFSMVSTSEDNGVPGGFRELLMPATDQFWLTVRPPAEQKKAKEEK